MERKSICNVMLSFVLLFVGACSSTETSTGSPEEDAVKSAIASWPEKWRATKVDRYMFAKSLLEDIRKIPEDHKQVIYLNKFADSVLSSSFEVGPKFPLEYWNTRPISIDAGDDGDLPRLLLLGRHSAIVDIGKLLYQEQSRRGTSMVERMNLVFRFAEKMEKERKRLNAMEVGGARDLIDDLERTLWYCLQGYQSKEKQRIREQFEKTVGRPIRDPEKILNDRADFTRKRVEASDRMIEEFKKAEYERLLRRK